MPRFPLSDAHALGRVGLAGANGTRTLHLGWTNRGCRMIGNGARAGLGALLLLTGSGGSAADQNKELSDKSVLTLMQYAWSLVPNKFTSPDGKVIEVDKSKPSEVVVPMETAREAIKVARLSAYAQVCDLIEEQRANYQTFMKREQAKAKWTDQQLLFINQLHLFNVMMLTGKVKFVE